MPRRDADKKVPVTMRALIQRINRKLAAEGDEGNWIGKRLKASRGAGAIGELGDFYILDVSRNTVVDHHVKPESLARDLDVLAPWEKLVE